MKKLILILLFATPVYADVIAVKNCPENKTGCYRVTEGNGLITSATEGSRLYRRAQEWISKGGSVQPADAWEPTLAQAQARRIKEIKKEARRIMAEHTDWYVIRKAENGAAIPASVQTYRAALRQATNDAESAINALATIETVRDYQPTWPDAPGE